MITSAKLKLSSWLSANGSIISNASSIVGSRAVTSVLGFGYWWLAARLFSAEAVGFASAIISSMMLLGSIGVLGLGTLLMGELPRHQEKASRLILASVLTAGAAGTALGGIAAAGLAMLSSDIDTLSHSIVNSSLFALGVGVTSIVITLDQAMIGLLRGNLQLGRNTFFAAAKLILILAVGAFLSPRTGMLIFAVWVTSNILSMVFLIIRLLFSDFNIRLSPEFGVIRKLGGTALGHHVLNLSIQATAFVVPALITVVRSAADSAYFYVAWMLVSNLAFAAPLALSTVLYTVGNEQPDAIARQTRFSIRLSLLIGGAASLVLLVVAAFILKLFGLEYANQAQQALRILSLGVVPMIVKYHYITLCRLQHRISWAALVMIFSAILELALIIVGLNIGGLFGLSIGWFVAVSVEAVFMFKTVFDGSKEE